MSYYHNSFSTSPRSSYVHRKLATLQDNYSVDIMHDMLKGVCKYDVGFLLKELIFNLKYFSIDTLNDRFESFSYGPTGIRNISMLTEINIKCSGCLKMSASEMLCFMKYFGLIIGDMVPEKSELPMGFIYSFEKKFLIFFL